MWSWRSIAPVIAATMVFGGCGGGTVETDAPPGDEPEDSGSEPDYEYESPLGEFLGWTEVNFDEEDAQAEAAAQELRVQELAATCMREQGFEYIPVDPSQYMFFEEGFDEGPEWGSTEFVHTYGFGVTTQRFSQEQVGPDLIGHDFPTFEEEGSEGGFVDPNQEYVDALTESEREAYFEALHGSFDEPQWDWMVEEREPTEEEMQEMDEWYQNEYEPTGCLEISAREVFEVDESAYEEFDEEFGDLLSEAYERLEASPELVAYRAEVEACMSEAGYEYLVEEEQYMYFEEKLEEAGMGWSDPLEGIDTDGWTDEQFEAAYRDYETRLLSAEQRAALAELQQEEIGMAVALDDCGGGWENEQSIMDPIRIEMERQFLEDNRDRLAPYEGVFGGD